VDPLVLVVALDSQIHEFIHLLVWILPF